jgi:hypothetical protein
MNEDMRPSEVARLLQLDENLREEASRVLDVSGLGDVIQQYGYEPVGSQVMRTMTWRDLDFEHIDETPDWDRHWKLGAELAQSDWVWKFSCAHAYRQPKTSDAGLYWGLRMSDPDGGPTWKIDLWTARAEEFNQDRERWDALLTDDSRVEILAIKEAVCDLPEYRGTMLSVHIYEAVLDHGVYGTDAFLHWWRER